MVSGARVYTLDESRPTATALAVRGGRIVYVGNDPSGWTGPDTKRIDARGATIIPVRVYAMIGGPGRLWQEYLKRGPEIGERLTVRSIKLMADGALGSRGAALLAPYSDEPGNSGLLMLDRAQIEKTAREAVAAGFQVNTHAIGDRANRTVLEAYGAAVGGKNDHRFRIEHAQVVAPSDFELFAKYSVAGAYAAFEEKWKGTLAPGMAADFVMLSKDIMRVPAAGILNAQVLLTVTGGEIVYSGRQ